MNSCSALHRSVPKSEKESGRREAGTRMFEVQYRLLEKELPRPGTKETTMANNTSHGKIIVSWRDALRIYPDADRFPLMSPAELKVLGEDIRQYGLREPVVVIRQYRRHEDGELDTREYDHVLIDGRNRL